MTDTANPPTGNPLRLQQEFLQRVGPSQQFHLLFEHLPDVYFFFKDDQSRLLGASTAILRRLGLKKEQDIIGTTDYQYFPAHIADTFVKDDRNVLQTGQPLINRIEIWYTEHRLLDWFVTTKLPIRDSRGTVIGVMGTVRSYEGNRKEIQTFSQIDQVVKYIRENHRRKITVNELAELSGVSARQLHRRFIELFGMSAQEFLAKTRIKAASDVLLSSDRSVGDIAAEFGFCDQSAFTQQFKKHVGETPLHFRRRHVGRASV
ncbi:AraC family transcriptional regulator [Stieleria varia]|uniref:Bifunctional transcriptional activator/DNA repair enzyme AdaA n=1 Tax=Stieleria varia TaxID=2528005 RepID=A0A5C6B6X6_9BACT|nr:AraC family transcriptional regulator [Stieleria varia]TWU07718.1 Bifunctional transcriptional activator/DNA repair enzyme AdaA [Stieleria varia]